MGGKSIVKRGSDSNDLAASPDGWAGKCGTLSRTWQTLAPAVP